MQKKSLLRITKLQFDIYLNKQIIRIDYDDQTTVGDVLDQISKQYKLPYEDISLYLAKKSGNPKLSFPALEKERQLIRTNEKRFVVVQREQQNPNLQKLREEESILENQSRMSIITKLLCSKVSCT